MNTASHNVDILGIPISKLNRQDTNTYISNSLSVCGNTVIFTPNAEILYKALRTPAMADILLKADLLLADGTGVVAASRLLKDPLPCRITGIDTAEFILSEAARQGLSVFLLGGRQGVAECAAKTLVTKYQGLRICGYHHGYFKNSDDVIHRISAASPDILFVCLGFPAQERFIIENAHKIPSLRLSIGLGGSLDVWSGNVRRAPKIMQSTGLEWLFRLCSDPKRIKRLPYLSGFCAEVIKESLNGK